MMIYPYEEDRQLVTEEVRSFCLFQQILSGYGFVVDVCLGEACKAVLPR